MGILYDNITTLCDKNGIKPSKMCSDIGISRSLITDLKMGRKNGVSAKTAQKIASYFGVSVGYLLGEETEVTPPSQGERSDILDEVDVSFYGDYKELTEDDKETLRAMARIMRERREKKQG